MNPKDRIGLTKPQIHLVPPSAIIYFAKAMENGAKKYGPYNWRNNPVNYTVYLSAMLRHILQLIDGEDIAQDSGTHHLAHVGASAAILLDALATGNLIDDRPVKGAASSLIDKLTSKGDDVPGHPIKRDISDSVVPVATPDYPIPGSASDYVPDVVGPDNHYSDAWSTGGSVGSPVPSNIK